MSVLPHSLSFILECNEYIPAFSHIEHLLMCLFTESKEDSCLILLMKSKHILNG